MIEPLWLFQGGFRKGKQTFKVCLLSPVTTFVKTDRIAWNLAETSCYWRLVYILTPHPYIPFQHGHCANFWGVRELLSISFRKFVWYYFLMPFYIMWKITWQLHEMFPVSWGLMNGFKLLKIHYLLTNWNVYRDIVWKFLYKPVEHGNTRF
jgi:hypothetical protein